MNYLLDWYSYNPRAVLSAEDFVKSNFFRLSRLMSDQSMGESEMYSLLMDYYSRYPDSMYQMELYMLGRPSSLVCPTFMNIGGVYKYK